MSCAKLHIDLRAIQAQDSHTPDGRFRLLGQVGKGAEGGVHAAIDEVTGQPAAVKIVHGPSAHATHAFYSQLQQLHHPHLVSVVDVQKRNNKCFIVMEKCSCDLLEAIQQSQHAKLRESTAAAVFIQLLSAVDFCHENRVIHGDIKPENVLLNEDGTVRLCDFFLDRRLATTGFASGSTVYLAPEIVNGTIDSTQDFTATDVWSLGVTLFVMVTGVLPWKTPTMNDEAFAAFTANPLGFLPSNLSFRLKTLLISMLTESTSDRIAPESIWQHPWVSMHQGATAHDIFEDYEDFDEYCVAACPLAAAMRMASPQSPLSLDADWDGCTDPELSPASKDHSDASFDFGADSECKTSYLAAFGVLASPTRAQTKRPRLGSCSMAPVLSHLIA